MKKNIFTLFAAIAMISCSNKSTDKPQLVEAKDSITVDSAAVAYSDSVLTDSNNVANIEGFAKEDVIILHDIAYEGNKIILSNRDQINFDKLFKRADNKEDIAVVKALRNMMVEHIDISVEYHEEICHTETIKGC